MPKRKYHTLHDDLAIDKEAGHRSRKLREKRRVRREIEEELAAFEEDCDRETGRRRRAGRSPVG